MQHNSITVSALPVITLDFQTVTVDQLEMQNPTRAADFEDRLGRPIDGLSAHTYFSTTFSPPASTSTKRLLFTAK